MSEKYRDNRDLIGIALRGDALSAGFWRCAVSRSLSLGEENDYTS